MATTTKHIKHTLACPRCLSPLVRGEGTRVYQDLVEHVSSPNAKVYGKEYFICSNKKCFTHVNDDFWDWFGDFYHAKEYDKDFFIFGINKALLSGSRDCHIKHDTKRVTILHLIWLKVYLEFLPIPDEPGIKIIGHKIKVRISVRKLFDKYWVGYTSGIHMFLYCIKSFDHNLKKFFENPKSAYSIHELIKDLEHDKYDKRWWIRLSRWYNNIKCPGLYKTLLKLKDKN